MTDLMLTQVLNDPECVTLTAEKVDSRREDQGIKFLFHMTRQRLNLVSA